MFGCNERYRNNFILYSFHSIVLLKHVFDRPFFVIDIINGFADRVSNCYSIRIIPIKYCENKQHRTISRIENRQPQSLKAMKRRKMYHEDLLGLYDYHRESLLPLLQRGTCPPLKFWEHLYSQRHLEFRVIRRDPVILVVRERDRVWLPICLFTQMRMYRITVHRIEE